MPTIKSPQISFGGGEVTPELYGRPDLGHNQTGAAELLNAWTLPHGPWQNRGGLEHVKECKNGGSDGPVRIIEFKFSQTQAYVVELGNLYARFHTEGGTILEANQVITAISQAAVGVITIAGHPFLDGEEVFLNSIVGMTELNGRYVKIANKTANTFEITDLQDNNIDTSAFTAYGSAGTAGRVYEVATPYAIADVFDIKKEQNEDVVTLTHPEYDERELKRLGAASWTLTTITFAPAIAAPVQSNVVASPASGTPVENYVVTAIAEDGLEESLASNEKTATNDISIAANGNTISWAAVTGAIRYNVYKERNGLHGFIGQTSDLSFIDGLGTELEPDLLTTPPENRTPFGTADNRPAVVGYFDERRIFLRTNTNPQSIWLVKSGTESNMSRSIPSRDDDSIIRTLKSTEQQTIQSMISIPDFLVFTTSGEWLITSKNSDAITPTTISARQQSAVGSSSLQALVVADNVLFMSIEGFHIHDIRIPENATNYKPRDISRVAPHLVDGFTFTDWTYKKSPHPMIFAVRSDGRLLGLTYVPGENPQVIGHHTHNTKFGSFESVASIPEENGPNGGEVTTYCSVKRKINGIDRRFLERFRSRRFPTVEDEYIVDAGRTLDLPFVITGITSANPPVVTTSSAHGFSNGDTVKIREVLQRALNEIGDFEEVNGVSFSVNNVASTTFELQSDIGTPANVDGTAWPTYWSGGTVRKEVTTISLAHHLEGETVSILADGNHLGDEVVVNGGFTLDRKASIVHYGLPIRTRFKSLPLKTADPAFGMASTKNITSVHLRVDKSRGLTAGPSYDKQVTVPGRSDEGYGVPNKAISSDREVHIDGNYDPYGQLHIQKDDPTALTVLSMVLEVKVDG